MAERLLRKETKEKRGGKTMEKETKMISKKAWRSFFPSF